MRKRPVDPLDRILQRRCYLEDLDHKQQVELYEKAKPAFILRQKRYRSGGNTPTQPKSKRATAEASPVDRHAATAPMKLATPTHDLQTSELCEGDIYLTQVATTSCMRWLRLARLWHPP